MANGFEDTSDTFKPLARYAFQDPNMSCSATLLSPAWAITAAHCVAPVEPGICQADKFSAVTLTDRREADINPITFWPFKDGGPTAPEDRVASHTFDRFAFNEVKVPVAPPLNLCTQEGANLDVALIRLDRRMTGVPFARLAAFSGTSCPTDLNGTLVGYGEVADGALACTEPLFSQESDIRTFVHDAWNRETTNSGFVFSSSWACGTPSRAGLAGDSGGALFRTDTIGQENPLLCGVFSRTYPDPDCAVLAPVPPFFVPTCVSSDVADLQSSLLAQFLADNILDTQGRLQGTCDTPSVFYPNGGLDTDADEDLVPDACDACPVTLGRVYNDELWGETQNLDNDGDGVAERCDSCPASRCVQIFGSGQGDRCHNPADTFLHKRQPDWDGDGIGDVCDICPDHPNSGLAPNIDPDGDKVGLACDTCPTKKNPPPACNVHADCLASIPGHDAQFARCIQAHVPLSTCRPPVGESGFPYGTNGFWPTCQTNADCADFGADWTCTADTATGYCSRQLDDLDGDGFGGVCDPCTTASNAQIRANSNLVAEEFQGADELGDVCDPVPVLVSRPVIRTLFELLPGELPGDPTADGSQVTKFASTATMGLESGEPPPDFKAPVGFRHCSCFDFEQGKPILDPRACFNSGVCSRDPADYDPKAGGWKAVTYDVEQATIEFYPPNGEFNFNQPTGPKKYDTPVSFTFRTDESCDTFELVHPEQIHPGDDEACKIGRRAVVSWYHAEDKAKGIHHYTEIGSSVEHTNGFFWSHVEREYQDGAILSASERDEIYDGKLRQNYAFLNTPLVVPPEFAPHSAIPLPDPRPCEITGCVFTWRPDWVVNPPDYLSRVNPFKILTLPARVQANPVELAALRTGGRAPLDVTAQVSPGVSALMRDPSIQWLTPQEPGSRKSASTTGVQAVTVPNTISPPAVPAGFASLVVQQDSKLYLAQEVGYQAMSSLSGSGTASAASDTGPVEDEIDNLKYLASWTVDQVEANVDITKKTIDAEADKLGLWRERKGAVGLFSATEHHAYFAGGYDDTYVPYGDVWRFDIMSGGWDLLFASDKDRLMVHPEELHLGAVLAAAYDQPSTTMVLLDEFVIDKPTRQCCAWTRLMAFDAATRTLRFLRAWPKSNTYDRFLLSATPDGQFVLVPLKSADPTTLGASGQPWQAWRFRVTSTGITWTGTQSGRGLIMDAPVNTSDGVVLQYIDASGRYQLHNLEERLDAPTSGPASL